MGLSVDLAPRKFLVVGPSPAERAEHQHRASVFTQEATTATGGEMIYDIRG